MDRRNTLSLAVIATLELAVLTSSTDAEQQTPKEQPQHSGSLEENGAWGVATESFINAAIAGAIGNCKTLSREEIGCGAFFTTIQAGWSLGFRCGRENIIVAEKKLADAERRAVRREIELRSNYVPDMPRCARVVTVDPNGAIVVSKAGYSIPISRFR